MNTIVVAPSVAPSANDMMLPESVMKVMPMATQPMNDMVVSSEIRLTVDRKPGVRSAKTTSAASASDADREQHAACAGSTVASRRRRALRRSCRPTSAGRRFDWMGDVGDDAVHGHVVAA